jgi:hypothetical protein
MFYSCIIGYVRALVLQKKNIWNDDAAIQSWRQWPADSVVNGHGMLLKRLPKNFTIRPKVAWRNGNYYQI